MSEGEPAEILARARSALRTGGMASRLAVDSGHLGNPIRVMTPNGDRESWFVPVTVSNRLAGFFRYSPGGALMQYSSLQRREDTVEGCPSAQSWTDPETIRRRVEETAKPGEVVGTPVLSYDRAPSRLAWAVPATSPEGTTRTVYVAGPVVWEAPSGEHDLDSYGGGPRR